MSLKVASVYKYIFCIIYLWILQLICRIKQTDDICKTKTRKKQFYYLHLCRKTAKRRVTDTTHIVFIFNVYWLIKTLVISRKNILSHFKGTFPNTNEQCFHLRLTFSFVFVSLLLLKNNMIKYFMFWNVVLIL